MFGSQMFSLLDSFFGYNKVLLAQMDLPKTMFRTKWGTFSFKCMPFGHINVGTPFKRVMDITFHGLIGQSVVVYLDDVSVFYRRRLDHVCNLNKIFEWCHKYGISLNHKKIIFGRRNSLRTHNCKE